MQEREVKTTCPYCGVGCGVVAQIDQTGRVSVKGDVAHPANLGRLCSKGSALAETLSLDDRLLYPEINGKRVTWNEAIDHVASGFKRIIDQHGPDAVAFYVSGQLLTEDYYVANKLMKGFIGSANIDTNSRLCMSSAVAGHVRAFGSDSVPASYEDIELADLIVLVGSNTAWCHPVIFQRMTAAKKARPSTKVVLIDPRGTATRELADLHLPIKPGTDVFLFNGLLNFLRKEDAIDWRFVEQHTEGFGQAFSEIAGREYSIPRVARACGLSESDVAEFYRLFSQTEKTVTLFSQGVNQSSSGVDKANSIINCHLVTGRIGKPGAAPFSITGQPNAMGGREVGGLANMLAAHMSFNDDDVDLVGRFWQSRNIARKPGLKAVDLFESIRAGKVKAVWIMATNPVVSMPQADDVVEGLKKCELVVVSDIIANTDTSEYAHVKLPALGWGEKDGTVTNSERRISRQRAFLPAPGEAKPDWWIVGQVAKRMGFERPFNYETPFEIFREHAALSGFENNNARDFDISGLARINVDEYNSLTPKQWPINAANSNGSARMFGDGHFFTSTRRARIITVKGKSPGNVPNSEFPLVLNTGRVRDQWHTLTRTGKSARLSAHVVEPYVEIHKSDAERYGLRNLEIAKMTTPYGEMFARVNVAGEQQVGTVFVPMHWNKIFASHGRVGALVNAVVDPISGQPELKHTPVRVEPYKPRWYGFVLSRKPITFNTPYWVKAIGDEHWRYEIASDTAPIDWSQWARALLGGEGEWIDFADKSAGRYRGACIENNRLEACVFISGTTELPARTWLSSLFKQQQLDRASRTALLSGKPAQGQTDTGPTVCACFNVGMNTIVDAIKNRGLTTPEAIGNALKAGTNCGSCVPELKALAAKFSGVTAV